MDRILQLLSRSAKHSLPTGGAMNPLCSFTSSSQGEGSRSRSPSSFVIPATFSRQRRLFYIVTVGAYHSRLLLRSCNEAPKGESLIKKIGRSLEAALDFTMEQRLLRTVKRLSESNAQILKSLGI